jgi:hypothetical protein
MKKLLLGMLLLVKIAFGSIVVTIEEINDENNGMKDGRFVKMLEEAGIDTSYIETE